MKSIRTPLTLFLLIVFALAATPAATAVISEEMPIRESITNAMHPIDVVFNGNNYVVLWHETDIAGKVARGLFAQLIEESGDMASGTVVLSSTGSGQAAIANGIDVAAIVWIEPDNQSNTAVHVGWLDANAHLIGPFTLAQTAGAQFVDVGFVNGTFVVAWSDQLKVHAGSLSALSSQLQSHSIVADDVAEGIHIGSNTRRMDVFWDARYPCTCPDDSFWTVVRGRELSSAGTPVAARFQLDLPFTRASVMDVDAATNGDLFVAAGMKDSHPSRVIRLSLEGVVKVFRQLPFANHVSLLWSSDSVLAAFERAPNPSEPALYLLPLTPLLDPATSVELEQAFTLSRTGGQESDVHLAAGNDTIIAVYGRGKTATSDSFTVAFRKIDPAVLPPLLPPPGRVFVASIQPRESSVDLTLTWDGVTSAKLYRVEAFPTDNVTAPAVEAEVKTETTILSLKGETTYQMHLIVENAAGMSPWSPAETFTTPPAQRPRAPEIVSMALNPNRVLVIQWKDVSSNEEGFRITARQGTGFTTLATLPANSTQASVTIPQATRIVGVSAFNGAGSSDAWVGPLDTVHPQKRRAIQH